MDYPLNEERRTDTRFGGDVLGGGRGTLRPGCSVTLVDLSAGGALVQAVRPLRPGARVHFQFHRGTRRFSMAAHVLRCAVWALDPQAGVTYRGALKFEHRCDMLWEPETHNGYHGPEMDGNETLRKGHSLPAHSDRVEGDRRRSRG